jgi:hypothetical protein
MMKFKSTFVNQYSLFDIQFGLSREATLNVEHGMSNVQCRRPLNSKLDIPPKNRGWLRWALDILYFNPTNSSATNDLRQLLHFKCITPNKEHRLTNDEV